MSGGAGDSPAGPGPEVYRLARSHRIEDAAAAVARTAGAAVTSIERSAVGASHAVYFVALDDGRRCVARFATHPDHDLPREVWATERCRLAGIPAPRLVAADLTPPDPSPPLAVYERLAGEPGHRVPLAPAERRDVLEQMARHAARIHAVRVTGAGRLARVASPAVPGSLESPASPPSPAAPGSPVDGYAGTASSWAEHALHALDRRLGELPPSALPPDMPASIRRRFEAGLPALEAAVPARSSTSALVHGDLRLENALLLRDRRSRHDRQGAVRVSAILDFEMVLGGDGAVDLAWLHYQDGRSESDLRAIVAAYGLPYDDPQLRRRIHLYQLHYALGHLWWEVAFKDHAGAAAVVSRISALLHQTRTAS